MLKTHDVARVLTALAQLLRRGPNVPLEDLRITGRSRPKTSTDQVPVALSTLVALSQFDKSQWIDLIHAYEFPVEIRPRDASRDILGKILRYLEESPEARKRLANQASRSRPDTSPELLRALQILLQK